MKLKQFIRDYYDILTYVLFFINFEISLGFWIFPSNLKLSDKFYHLLFYTMIPLIPYIFVTLSISKITKNREDKATYRKSFELFYNCMLFIDAILIDILEFNEQTHTFGFLFIICLLILSIILSDGVFAPRIEKKLRKENIVFILAFAVLELLFILVVNRFKFRNFSLIHFVVIILAYLIVIVLVNYDKIFRKKSQFLKN